MAQHGTTETLRELIEGLVNSADKNRQLTDTRHLDNVTRMARIETMVAHLDGRMDDLEKRIFGNGQPGEFAVIDKRINQLERWFWRVSGVIGFVVFLANLLLALKGK